MPSSAELLLEAPARAAQLPLTVVSLGQLGALQHAMPHAEAALAEQYLANGELPVRHEYTWQHLNRGRHAEIALRAGSMQCVDPCTGERLQCATAFVLPSEWVGIVYRFNGRERFDLVTSSFDQAKLGLWFPDRGVFVAGHVEPNWVQIGIGLVKALRAHEPQAAVRKHDASPGISGARSVLHLGLCSNLGHYLWNDLSGLETVIESLGAASIGAVVAGPWSYLPVEGIFPELAAAGVAVERWAKPLPACVAYPQHLPLRVAGNRMSRGLRRRIVAWAIEQERDYLAAAAEFNTPGVNLWFNLRLHNKAWVDQAQGIVALVRTFHNALPPDRPINVLLDGTPDTAAMARQIAAELIGVARVVDATSVPLSRSIMLSGLVDLHCCVIGSGLTIPHWVMGRRGVAHSNRPHLGQQRFWNNVAEGAHDVVFMPHESITDMDGPLTPDASYVNYRIDLVPLIQRLDALHRQLDTGPRRSGFEQMRTLAARGDFAAAAERLISA